MRFRSLHSRLLAVYSRLPGREDVGHLQLFDEKLVDALNVLDALLRTPEALAGVLEAAGSMAWSGRG